MRLFRASLPLIGLTGSHCLRYKVFPGKSLTGNRAFVERSEMASLQHLVGEVKSAQKYVPVTLSRDVDLLQKSRESIMRFFQGIARMVAVFVRPRLNS